MQQVFLLYNVKTMPTQEHKLEMVTVENFHRFCTDNRGVVQYEWVRERIGGTNVQHWFNKTTPNALWLTGVTS